MPNSPKKVLFLALSGIGNYHMQSPTIAAVKKAHPNWHITVWVAPRGTKALAEADPNVDQVIEAPIKNSFLGHIRTIHKLKAESYKLAIILSPGQLIKSAAYTFLAGIPQRIGSSYPLGKNPRSHFLLTDAIDEKENLHDIEQNLRLLEPLGIDYNLSPKTYNLIIPQSNKIEAKRIMSQLHIPKSKRIVGLHAGSAPDLTFKRWPLENFAAVAVKLIQDDNAHILIFGGPDEESQKQELQDQIIQKLSPSPYNLKPVHTISSNLLTTAAIMQRCQLLISNDSGLMHLAAASGVKTYGLFGPTDEGKTGPRGKYSHTIRAPGTKPVYDTERNFNLGRQPHPSILALTPQQVIDGLSQTEYNNSE